MMERHPDWERLEKLMPAVRAFQRLAQEHGIDDIFQDNGGIFQDNGGKILQMLLALNLHGIPGERVTTLLTRSEENTSELQSLMRNAYALFFLKKKKQPILITS